MRRDFLNKARIRALCLITLAILAGSVFADLVAADLTPVQYGFPTIVKSGSSVSYSNDQAIATDNEAFNLNFAPFSDLMSGLPSAGDSSTLSSGSGFSPITGQLISGLGDNSGLLDFNGLNLF
jgi:hypothetical protein